MKATNGQIQMILNNTCKIGVNVSQELYDVVRANEHTAIINADTHKTSEHFSKADWNKETKVLEVTFDDAKANVQKVHKAVAAVGHDTKLQQAKDEVYNKLPGCCKYDRTSEIEKTNESKHSGHVH